MDKVWQYFDSAGPLVGRVWPIGLLTLRGFGVRAFSSLVYPRKPDMATWLDQ